ncbi:hypothetical protein FRAAL0992 [Frankia alni ACN14a]|uniref:Uncharacterized protein n=1 Tax=Frankia alni (strain DSM 45986 / CECT 9034 / ACN14a) TaxID=326424 RepID=Q0RS08_FRAAA|nr:hypothetical protein FRAAL0992 [Frankia alni ACN14a]
MFVQADQGASVRTAAVFRYVDGHLRLVTLAGSQAGLAYGGSTGFVATWACRPAAVPAAAVVTASGPSDASGAYTVTLDYYRFQQASLVPLAHRTVGPGPLDSLPGIRDGVSGEAGCGQARLNP